ncbi:hypothetical protein N805_21560 [Pseudomonas putida S13.1.2]|uniref:Uncharacterized protein n=1 Tax=Pseudomonas putida S13.1.2 TaxID=1384061 RepID=A0AAU8SH99_PSEPU|nr:hypothetical protein N805_21560 [Pseudomonas putida S13.1.2]
MLILIQNAFVFCLVGIQRVSGVLGQRLLFETVVLDQFESIGGKSACRGGVINGGWPWLAQRIGAGTALLF